MSQGRSKPPASAALPGDLARRVVRWQRHAGRHDLPWQRTTDPYRVWLSEIMLQQTQVNTALAYYERFLQRFPDLASLANAPLDEVLTLWSGLGYYSRARNLHACAQAIVRHHAGRFPRTAEQLQTLPGIGRSTAAAIAAFCFKERVAILDGNVKRVLARVLAFDADLSSARKERELWALATALLPEDGADMPAYTQGVMDLGASVCAAKNPRCEHCPLAEVCAARRMNAQQAFPVKTKKLARKTRQSWWLWLQLCDAKGRKQVWLVQRPAQGVWAGLWTLPLFDSQEQAVAWAQSLQLPWRALESIQHALTHFDWTLHTAHACVDAPLSARQLSLLGEGRWIADTELAQIAVPAPLRKLLSS